MWLLPPGDGAVRSFPIPSLRHAGKTGMVGRLGHFDGARARRLMEEAFMRVMQSRDGTEQHPADAMEAGA